MVLTKRNERGFAHLEIVLLIIIAAIIGGVGWYVYHTKQNTDKTLNAASTTSNNAGPRFAKTATPSSAAASNDSLQSDQQSAASAANQGSKDLSSSNDSLNDKSTMTTVPQ
jgi:uncharacterized protein HemX